MPPEVSEGRKKRRASKSSRSQSHPIAGGLYLPLFTCLYHHNQPKWERIIVIYCNFHSFPIFQDISTTRENSLKYRWIQDYFWKLPFYYSKLVILWSSMTAWLTLLHGLGLFRPNAKTWTLESFSGTQACIGPAGVTRFETVCICLKCIWK